jgi:hypothetical protein
MVEALLRLELVARALAFAARMRAHGVPHPDPDRNGDFTLTSEALIALDSVPPRLDSRYVFTTTRKVPGSNEPGPFDVANFRRRVWAPAIDSAGIAKPARIYDLRSTFISNALANGLTVFETARIAGTSVKMIELHYGALIDNARESLLERLEGEGNAVGAGR